MYQICCGYSSESQTKLLRLEKENRELERSLQVLKQSSQRVSAEMEKTNKKLTAQIHADKKEIARLKEVHTHSNHSCFLLLHTFCHHTSYVLCTIHAVLNEVLLLESCSL